MRGKAAAQSANRRLAEALARIETLELQISGMAATHRQVVSDLRTELQRAQGSTARDIKRLSDDRVQAERDRADLAITEARNTHLAKVVAGVAKLDSIRPLMTREVTQWVEVAEEFGVQTGPLLAGLLDARGEPQSREVVRTTNAGARWKAKVVEEIESGELRYVPDPKKTERWREG